MSTFLPDTLEGFRRFHQDETIVVCGCGRSLAEFADHDRFITIGVNDVGRLFQPTYLVVVNPRRQFSSDRFDYVARSGAQALFTQLDLGIDHSHIVRFTLGQQNGVTYDTPNSLPYTRNSPYVAVCLAALMGARRIGLIGVDFTDDHFFARTGRHPLAGQLATVDQQYQRLNEALHRRGVHVINLSGESRLTAFCKGNLAELHGLETYRKARNNASGIAARPLNILSYATTPVAGVPTTLARCISAATPHQARCLWARNHYGNGVVFEGDVEWTRVPREAERLIREADLVVVHNGKVEPAHRSLLAQKPVITMAHNYRWNIHSGFVDMGFPGVVVGQYQATLPEFADWSIVPNPVPLWEPAYQPEVKPDVVTIAYTPFGRHDSYPRDHKLYWHGKGYTTTISVLDALSKRYPIDVLAVRGRQFSHSEALAAKRRAHIVIDECVTGSYHRNSLEGLACGCVVVNGVEEREAVGKVFSRCAPNSGKAPFVYASIDTLETVLAALIESGASTLNEAGQRNRAWFDIHWDFARHWDLFWRQHVETALATSSRATRAAPSEILPSSRPQPAASAAKEAISIIIPHGGAERNSLLHACLERLNHHSLVGEIIVAEMGSVPAARGVAAEFDTAYVFIGDQGIFHKTRAMNVALPLASHDLLLWLDDDLILPDEFLDRAVAECKDRNLDCLIPWTSVRYLSDDDTNALLRGEATANSCTPVKTLWSRRGACGGAVLVRRDFIGRYGGMCEEFCGWGGEDNAWYHKARLLGRAAVTVRTDQNLYHLYHPRSGAYGQEQPSDRNPNYARNVALLNEACRLTSPKQFLARFPAPTSIAPPWSVHPRFDIRPPHEGSVVSALLQTLPTILKEAYGTCDEHSNGATMVDIQISCEDVARSDRTEKVIIRRVTENGERDEELSLDRQLGRADAKLMLKKMIAPLSVLLADSAPNRTVGETVSGSVSPRSGAVIPMKLNLGCCDSLLEGYANIDIVAGTGVETADLRKPWPWPDSSVDFIRAHDIIEHLPDKIFTMNEMWRVLKPGCEAEIVVPTTEGPGAFQDPTHVSFWNRRSFMYYEVGNPYRDRFARSYGIVARLRVVRERLDMTQDGPKLTIILAAVK